MLELLKVAWGECTVAASERERADIASAVAGVRSNSCNETFHKAAGLGEFSDMTIL